MKRSNKTKDKIKELDLNNLDYSQSIFFLKIVYENIINIIDVFCTGYLTVRSEKLNLYYITFQKIVADILKQEELNKLRKCSPQLFDGLMGDIEGMDIEWELSGKKQAYDFFNKIEKIFIENGAKTYGLPTFVETILKELNRAIGDHKKYHDKLWAGEMKKVKNSKQGSLLLKLSYNERTREIHINNTLLARPNFDSTNHSVFEFLYQNEFKVFSKKDLEEDLKIKTKGFNTFLNEINIKGTLRKYLFSISKNKISLRKEVEITNKDDIKEAKDELLLIKEKSRKE